MEPLACAVPKLSDPSGVRLLTAMAARKAQRRALRRDLNARQIVAKKRQELLSLFTKFPHVVSFLSESGSSAFADGAATPHSDPAALSVSGPFTPDAKGSVCPQANS